jgi:hypothetical protein
MLFAPRQRPHAAVSMVQVQRTSVNVFNSEQRILLYRDCRVSMLLCIIDEIENWPLKAEQLSRVKSV